MRARPLVRVWLVALVVLLLPSAPARAWPKETYRAMVYDTLRLLPPRLSRVLLKREAAILRGVRTLEGETASMIARDGVRGRLSAALVKDVERRIEQVVRMVGEHDSFNDMAYELGRLLRIAADLADPVILGAGRRDLQRVAPELYRYVDLNLTKFPLVHDGALSSPLGGASIGRLLVEVTSATSASVAPLAKAFWRDGRIVSARSFDFRSVPYAETSLNYSRGVTAASYLWLSAWAKANGDFTGYRFAPNKP